MKQVIAYMFVSGVFGLLITAAACMTMGLIGNSSFDKSISYRTKEKISDVVMFVLIISIWLFATSIGMAIGYALVQI